MSDEEAKVILATVSSEIRFLGDRFKAMEMALSETIAESNKRATTFGEKVEEIKESAHKTELVVQHTDDRLKSHESADDSRFRRLWWVLGAGGSTIGAVLFRVVFK